MNCSDTCVATAISPRVTRGDTEARRRTRGAAGYHAAERLRRRTRRRRAPLPRRPARCSAAHPPGCCGLARRRPGCSGPARFTVADAATAALARRLVDIGVALPRPDVRPMRDVTIVIPVRDRVQLLHDLLTALRADPETSSLPVLVVDDGSVNPAAVASVTRRHDATLLAHPHNQGPARGTQHRAPPRQDGVHRLLRFRRAARIWLAGPAAGTVHRSRPGAGRAPGGRHTRGSARLARPVRGCPVAAGYGRT